MEKTDTVRSGMKTRTLVRYRLINMIIDYISTKTLQPFCFVI